MTITFCGLLESGQKWHNFDKFYAFSRAVLEGGEGGGRKQRFQGGTERERQRWRQTESERRGEYREGRKWDVRVGAEDGEHVDCEEGVGGG